jgi:transcriptional regulator with XRE-family HTH domain
MHPLERFRRRAGLSVRDLARLTDSSPAQISRIETSGQDPTLAFIRRVRRVPGCTISADAFMRYGVERRLDRDEASR